MFELRWLKRQGFKNGRPVDEEVLQYRNLLSDLERSAVVNFDEAELAKNYEKWKDVPTVTEAV